MPIILPASSKGGSGKTTTAMVLASELTRGNIDFTLIDVDPNKHLAQWAHHAGITHIVESSESTIAHDIRKAETETPFVIIDVEGSKNTALSRAINMADLVLITCQPSDLDAIEAIKLIKYIEEEELVNDKKIKYALLRTLAGAFFTNIEKAIVEDFRKEGSEILTNRLMRLEAFKKMTSHGCCLHDLEANKPYERKAKENAMQNAYNVTEEVLTLVLDTNSIKKNGKEREYV